MNNIEKHEPITSVDITDDGLDLLVRQAQAMDAAHKLATALCNTSMVPKAFRGKPDDGAAAILYGAELGLKPQQALQQVFVVNGQPAIYARTMAGLLKAKGYRFETIEDTPTQVIVQGTSPRGEVETSTWTIERATSAGYTKNALYKSDPQAMLYAKALSEVCRKLAPDVLLGIRYTAEDLQLEPVRMKARRTSTNTGMQKLRQALEEKTTAPKQDNNNNDNGNESSGESALEAIEATTTRQELTELMETLSESLTDEEYDQVRLAANTRHEQLGN